MHLPQNLKYTKDHEWISIEGNIGTIGITDFAQRELGDIVYVDIATLGESVERETIFGTVEAVKTVSDLFMPLTGRIIEVNKSLDTAPELVNQDPYENGWMIKIEIADESQIADLLSVEQYSAIVAA